MLKLIKEAQQNDALLQTHVDNLTENLTQIAATLDQDLNIVTESISHVLANITMSVSHGQPIDPNLAYGRADTLAAFLAGVEYLASLPQASDGVKRYFASVAVRGGQITNIDAVGKIGHIGNDKNERRKIELLDAINHYNETQDPQAAKIISSVVGKIRMATDRMLHTSRDVEHAQPAPSY